MTDPMKMPPNPKAPSPGQPNPVWHCTFTADEMAEIGQLRGPSKGLSGMNKFVKDAVLEKARREARGEHNGVVDLETLSPKELQSLALNVIGKQMERAAETISKPGYRFDVKGDLLIDPNGEPVSDVDQVTKAQAELRQWLKSLREIKGLDAPSKKRVKHTVVHQQILEIAGGLGIATGDGTEDEPLALTAGDDD